MVSPSASRLDLGLCGFPPCPGRALDGLAWLEVLVDLEEVLDLEPVELRKVAEILQVLEAGIVGRYRDEVNSIRSR